MADIRTLKLALLADTKQFIDGLDKADKETSKDLLIINPAFYRPAEVDLLWGDSNPARQELGWFKFGDDSLIDRPAGESQGGTTVKASNVVRCRCYLFPVQ